MELPRRLWALRRISREAAMGARRKRADFFFCSRSNSFGPAAHQRIPTGRASGDEKTESTISGEQSPLLN
ncbi:hypothetical protein GUJ93_ZPchr0012g18792 [Zizania palustris]|uniref:Uncharacterized protein n=1 Tax=Zizania palustris TaxID=103762 RepID=A0A8J5VP82_ZIZPA|nr:hypothetical protein GUJ93_ZPchr0007g3007 [Zizania palustris]KAG8084116.1 hypothetical protein GUJ93_ZPchr0010g8152 [Zizania palustris]KAG8092184.1 hypothetical protein GUJ93_ZPchr0012g18792 [Zizania palustris]